jgi:predicted dehydrogenase
MSCATSPSRTTFAKPAISSSEPRKNGRLFAIAHGYTAYPMTRHARQLVRDGAIGPVRLVQVEYIQAGMATKLEDGPINNRLRWVLDPARSGQALVMSAIGCHAQHLASFVSGFRCAKVAADVQALMPGRKVVDYVSALIEFEGGARGTFTVTQAAAGGENDIRLRVYGEKGMLEWWHRDPSYLRFALQGEPARTITRGDPFLPPENIALGHSPRGHPEGLAEAFGNIYAEVAQERMARSLGDPVPNFLSEDRGRRAHDGVHRGVHRLAGQRARGCDVATKPRPSLVLHPRWPKRRRRYFIRLGSQSEIAGMYVTSRSARHIAP